MAKARERKSNNPAWRKTADGWVAVKSEEQGKYSKRIQRKGIKPKNV